MTHCIGHFRHTSVQLNMALNVNYQPFGSGSHVSTRQDVKKEWARLLPPYDEQFESSAKYDTPAPRLQPIPGWPMQTMVAQ